MLRRLVTERFDVLVIGGGITGAGIARDAAMRGLRTALLEQRDFASGTSSRSSRLIHGGVRYLEHGHLHLVFESSRERRTLLHIAPHLVRPLAFTWPVYRGARVSRPKLYAGLALYDALALFRNVAPHERLNAADVLRHEPMLRPEALLAGAVYFDAATDDARLTLANVVDAGEAGAVVLNYAEVAELVVGTGGRVVGALAADTLGGERITVGARVIVNATGPWTDSVRRLETQSSAPSILGSKGAHIAVPRARVGNRWAVTILHPGDGRVMFALPAGDHTIVGTTETASESGPADVRADREDVAYLLAAANAYFPSAALGERDVVAAWAGIRPLAAGLAAVDAGSASREHAITVGTSGVLHVTGGKLTTYRTMAEEVVDHVVDAVGRPLVQRCRTARLPLPGGDFSGQDDLREEAAAAIVSAPTREHLMASYGSRWRDVWEYAQREPVLAEPITPELPHVGAQFAHAAEHEMALSLGDLLVRRTHAAFQLPDHGLGIASRVATIVAPLLAWDSRRVDKELRGYDEEVQRIFG